ncbi:hypothetical protein D3C81_1604030 [compost metagenome]
MPPPRPHHDHGGAEYQQGRPEPQQPRQGPHRRVVEHEVAIALHEEVLHGGLTRATAQLFADLAAQVHREVGVGIGQRLVLADHAA